MPKIRVQRWKMTKVEVEMEVPKNCRYCNHRYGHKCDFFNEELTMYNNGGNDWGFKRCDECLQAEAKDKKTM